MNSPQDAHDKPENQNPVKKKVEKAYRTGFKLTCSGSSLGGCLKYTVNVIRTNCPGLYRFTVALSTGHTTKARCEDTDASDKKTCDTGFLGGCKSLSGKRSRFETRPKDQINGACKPADGSGLHRAIPSFRI